MGFISLAPRRLRAALAALAFGLIPSLSLAQACPDIDAPASAPLSYTAGVLAAPQVTAVVAGGSLDLLGCPDVPGSGWIAPNADFEMSVSGTLPDTTLEFRVTGDCDTTFLVNDSTGAWQFGDDSAEGVNPIVQVLAADGIYDLWVGTYDQATCNAQLSVQVIPGLPTIGDNAPVGNGLCPDVSLVGAPLDYDAAVLVGGQRIDVTAGGEADLAGCPETGAYGFVAVTPDFELNLAGAGAGANLTIGVEAECDAVLLINDASGAWLYADDTNGTNPAINIPAAVDGVYDIWAGTFGSDLCPAALTLSVAGAGGGTTAPPPKGGGTVTPPPTVDALPDPGNLTAYREQIGQTFAFTVTGTTTGGVWGTDVYTDDSTLGAAAVHAGMLQPGQTGTVTVMIVGPTDSFTGTQRNGVTSNNYGAWGGSYMFMP